MFARDALVGVDAHILRLYAAGEDLAGVVIASLIEGTGGRPILFPFFSVRAGLLAASMAIDSLDVTAGAPLAEAR